MRESGVLQRRGHRARPRDCARTARTATDNLGLGHTPQIAWTIKAFVEFCEMKFRALLGSQL
jgi:hypothetical protein